MAKVKVYNSEGEEVKEKKLSAKIFEHKINPEVIHDVVVAMEANKRIPYAHTKGRSEVRGGGKKPWRQKGTGRARHGSSRSPLWSGGGVTFGPTSERNYKKKINKKVKQAALFMILTDKLNEQAMCVIDKIDLKEMKTKKFLEIINVLPVKEKKTLVIIADPDVKVEKSARNLPKVKMIKSQNINILDLLSYSGVLFTEKAIDSLEKIYS